MLITHRLLWIVPVASFFLNPGFACSSDPEFQYGAVEMRAAVEGDWTFDITPAGGTANQLTVHVVQAPSFPNATAKAPERSFVRAAYACGGRTLVASAGACTDYSQMPLTVTFVSGDASWSTARMTGGFIVDGLVFSRGRLEMSIGTYSINANVAADGTVTSPSIVSTTGGGLGTVSITRS
jgi:hypothetical protein